MTYYKATRIDGTSFQDGTTTWTVGETTELPEAERGSVLCNAGVLHASTEPGESLVGGRWPCRLFEVEPLGELITDDDHPYKVGAHAWRVLAEIEAWRALGPNGEAVAALIERTESRTYEEVERLDAAWSAAFGAAWSAARSAARSAAWDAARDAAWDAARDAALDAVAALLVRDLITCEQFDLLYGPWKSVMEVSHGA